MGLTLPPSHCEEKKKKGPPGEKNLEVAIRSAAPKKGNGSG